MAIVKLLAPPIVRSEFDIPPAGTYPVELPQQNIHEKYSIYGLGGALLVWRGDLDVDFQGNFESVYGNLGILSFNALELASLGQFASLPDNVFPVFQQGSQYNALKWSPVSPYTFKRLQIIISNNNPTPIHVSTLILIYYGYLNLPIEGEIEETINLEIPTSLLKQK